jgi:hypothetical protein
MTDDHNAAWTEESRFRGALDDVIIIPLVLIAFVLLATSVDLVGARRCIGRDRYSSGITVLAARLIIRRISHALY